MNLAYVLVKEMQFSLVVGRVGICFGHQKTEVQIKPSAIFMDALFQFDMNLQMLLSLQAYLCPYLGKAIKFSGISNRRPTGAYCVNTFPVN